MKEQDRSEHAGQSFDVSFEAGMGNLDILPASEAPQALWQITGLRHQGAIDEDRDHANPALEGGFDLDSNKIIRIVDAPPIVLVRGNPFLPITAMSASQAATRSFKASNQSTPGSILSTSRKTFSRPTFCATRS
jgi:hypothetical protein